LVKVSREIRLRFKVAQYIVMYLTTFKDITIMKKLSKLTILAATLVFNLSSWGSCTIISDLNNDTIISQKGDCTTSQSPCSTFKIPLSLMGYDSGILKDASTPEWKPEERYKTMHRVFLDVWNQPLNPTTWIKYSGVWYSQKLTETLGMKKFQDYVNVFDYGNRNLSGDKGKNNGLTNSWLSSSLQISPKAQINFLKKLIKNELPVSQEAHAKTKQILFVEELANGWKLYGKTGAGHPMLKDGERNPNIHLGWFVGWAEKNNQTYVFSSIIEFDNENDTPIGRRARDITIQKLMKANIFK
jgi:beta-lactamase class D